MKKLATYSVVMLLTLALLVACTEYVPDTGVDRLKYPETATVDHIDDYHGTEVADPFRWLEDDVRENQAVRDWVDAQNAVTFSYLATIPEREVITRRMKELWDYERYSLPEKMGGRYFYEYNNGLQNQEILYTQTSLDAEPELLIDPNTWSDDGTVALASYFP
ncbi:MAG: S9 family peptidase, partial [Gammaproteobacteria bacterium]|nr:S9 family peptidase [Gammaproteobacteria bacterium]